MGHDETNLLLFFTRVGQWSWKIKEDVRTLGTPRGISGVGKISLLGAITREIIWSQRKCKVEREERGREAPREGVTCPRSLLEPEGRAGIST